MLGYEAFIAGRQLRYDEPRAERNSLAGTDLSLVRNFPQLGSDDRGKTGRMPRCLTRRPSPVASSSRTRLQMVLRRWNMAKSSRAFPQWGIEGQSAKRYRIKNNLPGTRNSARWSFARKSSRDSSPSSCRSRPRTLSPMSPRTCSHGPPLSCCSGTQSQLRNQRQAPAPGPHPALGPCHRRSRSPAARPR